MIYSNLSNFLFYFVSYRQIILKSRDCWECNWTDIVQKVEEQSIEHGYFLCLIL